MLIAIETVYLSLPMLMINIIFCNYKINQFKLLFKGNNSPKEIKIILDKQIIKNNKIRNYKDNQMKYQAYKIIIIVLMKYKAHKYNNNEDRIIISAYKTIMKQLCYQPRIFIINTIGSKM